MRLLGRAIGVLPQVATAQAGGGEIAPDPLCAAPGAGQRPAVGGRRCARTLLADLPARLVPDRREISRRKLLLLLDAALCPDHRRRAWAVPLIPVCQALGECKPRRQKWVLHSVIKLSSDPNAVCEFCECKVSQICNLLNLLHIFL